MQQGRDAFDLSGRTVIVTGAGSGIGRGMTMAFAAAGAEVAACDINMETAEESASLAQGAGGSAFAVQLDVGEEEAVNSTVARLLNQWGRIDILCNNAGVLDRMELVADIQTEVWNHVLRVNLTGPLFMTRAAIPSMLERKYGIITNTASEAALRGAAGGCAYTAAKTGLVGMTRSIAWSHAAEGIRCNAICPGPVETGMTALDPATAFDAKGLARLMPGMALAQRMAKPADIASVAVFLASDSASFINGALIPVDLGWAAS
jgi:NAD(P)-dependent dehydrogenase (short-subunit alcohol dehydrogenase family)